MRILGAVVIAALLAAPAVADAKTWRGKTKQGRGVSVRTGADGIVDGGLRSSGRRTGTLRLRRACP